MFVFRVGALDESRKEKKNCFDVDTMAKLDEVGIRFSHAKTLWSMPIGEEREFLQKMIATLHCS
jgi:hypothetical protein